jgi:hypothetical protein
VYLLFSVHYGVETNARYRYNGAIPFDSYMTNFKCPKCTKTCNCTHCCSKRGETYVTTRSVKVDIPISEHYEKAWKALVAAKAQRSRQNAISNRRSLQRSNAGNILMPATSLEPLTRLKSMPMPTTVPKLKPRAVIEPSARELEISKRLALPTGAVWGTIYGLDMGRIGIGVVADANSSIIVQNDISSDVTADAYKNDPENSEGDDPGESDEEEEQGSKVGDAALNPILSQTTSEFPTSLAPVALSNESAERVPTPLASSAVVDVPTEPSPLPTPVPRKRRRGHFIGKPVKSWKVAKQYKLPKACRPRVHAYIGRGQLVRSFVNHSSSLCYDPICGPFTSNNADSERDAEGKDDDSIEWDENKNSESGHGSGVPSQPQEQGGAFNEDLQFILAKALHVIQKQRTYDQVVPQLPQGQLQVADARFSANKKPAAPLADLVSGAAQVSNDDTTSMEATKPPLLASLPQIPESLSRTTDVLAPAADTSAVPHSGQ